MRATVELIGRTDPPYTPNRRVRYYTVFNGSRSQELDDYAVVLKRVIALCEEHDAVLHNRSDGDKPACGALLQATLGR